MIIQLVIMYPGLGVKPSLLVKSDSGFFHPQIGRTSLGTDSIRIEDRGTR